MKMSVSIIRQQSLESTIVRLVSVESRDPFILVRDGAHTCVLPKSYPAGGKLTLSSLPSFKHFRRPPLASARFIVIPLNAAPLPVFKTGLARC